MFHFDLIQSGVIISQASLLCSPPMRYDIEFTCSPPHFKEKEYIFSVVNEESRLPVLGLRVSENQIHLLVTSSGGGVQRRLNFKDVGLDDDHWHTVTLAITGPYATLIIDCGLPLEL